MHCCAALSMKGLAHEDGEGGTDLCGTEGVDWVNETWGQSNTASDMGQHQWGKINGNHVQKLK